jgi:hypothetical protein
MIVIKEGRPDAKTAASRLDNLHRTLDSERERRDVLARNCILGRDLRGSALSEIRRDRDETDRDASFSVKLFESQQRDHRNYLTGSSQKNSDDDESREGGGGGRGRGGGGGGGGEKYDEQDGFNRDDMIPHNNILSNKDKPARQSIDFTAMNSGSNSHFTVPGDTDPTAYCLLDMDVYPRLHGWLLMASNDASQV